MIRFKSPKKIQGKRGKYDDGYNNDSYFGYWFLAHEALCGLE